MFREPMEIVLSLPAVFLATSFHEFAHAWTELNLVMIHQEFKGV